MRQNAHWQLNLQLLINYNVIHLFVGKYCNWAPQSQLKTQ